MIRLATAVGLASLIAGCIAPPSAATRLADSAIDMNTAMRFGRMDIAMDYVNSDVRADFTHDHAGWGKKVRIDDIEFGGVSVKEKEEAEVYVTVTWQTQSDPTMRETRVIQRWKDKRGTWSIISESTEGDPGLFGDKPRAKVVAPTADSDTPDTTAELPPPTPAPQAPVVARPGTAGRHTTVISAD